MREIERISAEADRLARAQSHKLTDDPATSNIATNAADRDNSLEGEISLHADTTSEGTAEIASRIETAGLNVGAFRIVVRNGAINRKLFRSSRSQK
jgi:hypothetical protein